MTDHPGDENYAYEIDVDDTEVIGGVEEEQELGELVTGYFDWRESDDDVEIQKTRHIASGVAKNIPDFKSGTEERCLKKKVFGKKICWSVPYSRKRKCDVRLDFQVSHRDLDSIWNDIKGCTEVATAAGIAAFLATGYNAALAKAAFVEALKLCLVAKGTEAVESIEVGIKTTKINCSSWSRL